MKNILFVLLAVITSLQISAQKFGYVNSTQLLAEHPEIKTADTQLQSYQAELMAQGQQKVQAFETKYQQYVKEANAGGLSQIQMQEQETILAQEQQELQKFEVEMQQKLGTKREQLYEPILGKVRNALDAIGKEEGFTMIFDSSAGALLHADSSEDLTSKLRAKLGL